MPGIVATYNGNDYEGVNRVARKQGEENPIIKIREASPSFAVFLKALAKVPGLEGKKPRSAFSCAEAHALSKVLAAARPPVDWTAIRFPIATDGEGLELWVPCANCSEWLELESGFGSKRSYKISANGLKHVRGPEAASSSAPNLHLDDEKEWPALGKK